AKLRLSRRMSPDGCTARQGASAFAKGSMGQPTSKLEAGRGRANCAKRLECAGLPHDEVRWGARATGFRGLRHNNPFGKSLKALWERFLGAALLGFVFVSVFFITGCGGHTGPEVVLYCSQDEVYAEPICKEFERQTGIKVRPVFDTESVKT